MNLYSAYQVQARRSDGGWTGPQNWSGGTKYRYLSPKFLLFMCTCAYDTVICLSTQVGDMCTIKPGQSGPGYSLAIALGPIQLGGGSTLLYILTLTLSLTLILTIILRNLRNNWDVSAFQMVNTVQCTIAHAHPSRLHLAYTGL